MTITTEDSDAPSPRSDLPALPAPADESPQEEVDGDVDHKDGGTDTVDDAGDSHPSEPTAARPEKSKRRTTGAPRNRAGKSEREAPSPNSPKADLKDSQKAQPANRLKEWKKSLSTIKSLIVDSSKVVGLVSIPASGILVGVYAAKFNVTTLDIKSDIATFVAAFLSVYFTILIVYGATLLMPLIGSFSVIGKGTLATYIWHNETLRNHKSVSRGRAIRYFASILPALSLLIYPLIIFFLVGTSWESKGASSLNAIAVVYVSCVAVSIILILSTRGFAWRHFRRRLWQSIKFCGHLTQYVGMSSLWVILMYVIIGHAVINSYGDNDINLTVKLLYLIIVLFFIAILVALTYKKPNVPVAVGLGIVATIITLFFFPGANILTARALQSIGAGGFVPVVLVSPDLSAKEKIELMEKAGAGDQEVYCLILATSEHLWVTRPDASNQCSLKPSLGAAPWHGHTVPVDRKKLEFLPIELSKNDNKASPQP